MLWTMITDNWTTESSFLRELNLKLEQRTILWKHILKTIDQKKGIYKKVILNVHIIVSEQNNVYNK